MTSHVLHGRGDVLVPDVPGAVFTSIAKPPATPLTDPSAAVRNVLENPIGSRPLAELAQGRASACIVICDITRPVPNHLFLRPMVETLVEAGIPLEAITILVATGLHRPNLGPELDELVGDPWVVANVRIGNHFARDEAMLVDLGRTSTRGTPIHLNRLFVEADLRIVTGLIEPHFMAGWSGGRKVVAPGVAGHETIRTFHSHRFMADPLAIQCNLAGNPLHEEQLQIVAAVGEIYALSTVIDEQRRLLQVTFGDVIASHQVAVDFAAGLCEVAVARRFHTVVTSSAGYPLDKTYYQTVKGMVTPLDILEPGGTLIMVSECEEGLGSPEFAESQARLAALGPKPFLEQITPKRLADIDEWQTQMLAQAMLRARIQLFGARIAPDQQQLACVEVIDDLAVAIAASIERSGDPAVAVIPEGPYVVPVV
ncbi:nickel-dependent lactate racemase family protein [Aestuariimicrobium ganziense]|uniref:nickel-dependent lactate racemase n=1 Tax=Aestuariimicrobium ganziense TaxID=2773677 RepID=UPI0019425222|nr:nickel-dependent lactate racemase [Aestuariimicrobium ganziense]